MEKIKIEIGSWVCSSRDTHPLIFNGKKLSGERFYYGGTESNPNNFSEYMLFVTDKDLIVVVWAQVSLQVDYHGYSDYTILSEVPDYEQELVGRVFGECVKLPAEIIHRAVTVLGKNIVDKYLVTGDFSTKRYRLQCENCTYNNISGGDRVDYGSTWATLPGVQECLYDALWDYVADDEKVEVIDYRKGKKECPYFNRKSRGV